MDSSQLHEEGAPKDAGNIRLLIIAIIAVLLMGLAARQLLYWTADPSNFDPSPSPRPEINAPFITSKQVVVEKMVEVADLTSSDLVYDLGCGDGRIVITAAVRSGCRGVGIDINPERVAESTENARLQGVGDRVGFREQDVFTVDLREADVAMMYLTGWMIAKLEAQFEQMKPGSRILTQDFWLEQVRPNRVVHVKVGEDQTHSVFLYTTPLRRDPTMERGKPPQPEDTVEYTQHG